MACVALPLLMPRHRARRAHKEDFSKPLPAMLSPFHAGLLLALFLSVRPETATGWQARAEIRKLVIVATELLDFGMLPTERRQGFT